MKHRTVTILHGSPRKEGNSATLAKALMEGAGREGAEVRFHYLHGMEISPCTGCGSCQDEPGSGCIIRDDMRMIYEDLNASDAVVFAGPVYWFSVSAQTKKAIDRLYAVGGTEANTLEGKALGLILTYADEDPFVSGASNAVRMFQDISSYLGVRFKGVVHGSAQRSGEVAGNLPLMEAARMLGRRLAGDGP